MLIASTVVRGLIVAMGIALVFAAPTDTMRLFGILAIVFGVYRLYVLFRFSASAPPTDARDEDLK